MIGELAVLMIATAVGLLAGRALVRVISWTAYPETKTVWGTRAWVLAGSVVSAVLFAVIGWCVAVAIIVAS